MYISPFLDNAIECEPPPEISSKYSASIDTGFGSLLSFVSPTPSCPYTLEPQAYSFRPAEIAKQCEPPQAIFVIDTSESNFTNLSVVDSFLPSLPFSDTPQVKTLPSSNRVPLIWSLNSLYNIFVLLPVFNKSISSKSSIILLIFLKFSESLFLLSYPSQYSSKNSITSFFFNSFLFSHVFE